MVLMQALPKRKKHESPREIGGFFICSHIKTT